MLPSPPLAPGHRLSHHPGPFLGITIHLDGVVFGDDGDVTDVTEAHKEFKRIKKLENAGASKKPI